MRVSERRLAIEQDILAGFRPFELKAKYRELSPATVDKYIQRDMAKLGENDRAQVLAARSKRAKPIQHAHRRAKSLGPLHIRIGLLVARFRVASKMNPSDFVEHYGFSNRLQIVKIENGQHDLTLTELIAIADMVEIPVEQMFKETI